jgi:hypothetical protein
MTSQTTLKDSIEGAQAPVIKQHFSLPLAIALLALGMILGVFATTLTTAKTEPGEPNSARRIDRDFPARPDLVELEMRAIKAEAERYTSLGLFYAVGNGAEAQRAIGAEAARYNGLTEFFMAKNGQKQAAIQAEIARYNGLTDFYGANTQRAIQAETARYNGLADFYGAMVASTSLAWPPRPAHFYPAENALVVYHQSEWGRLTRPVMSAAETIKHDREYGLAAFSIPQDETGSVTGPDDDIGLMELTISEK